MLKPDIKKILFGSSKKEPLFLVFENRYKGLRQFLEDSNYSQTEMGEIMWFYSLMKTLQARDIKVVHCKNELLFRAIYNLCAKKYNVILIMDYITIPKTIGYLEHSIDNLFCMCFWGRNEDGVRALGSTANGKYIRSENVLTPFEYRADNSYLGFNMEVLCGRPTERKYERRGVLWGKKIEDVDLDLVRYLCDRGIRFYTTSSTPIEIQGVTNLGLLSKQEWQQLLSDCEFVLGSGNPRSGPTILEALYFETVLFGPRHQFPDDTHNSNIKFTDGLSHGEVFDLLSNVTFEPNSVTEKLCQASMFNDRIDTLFNLKT